MVHIRPPSASTTRRCDCHRYDPLVVKRFDSPSNQGGCSQGRWWMESNWVSGNFTVWEPAVARVLVIKRARSVAGRVTELQMASAVHAAAHIRQLGNRKTWMVEGMALWKPTKVWIYHPKLGYCVHKESAGWLFCVYNMGCVSFRWEWERRKHHFARCVER